MASPSFTALFEKHAMAAYAKQLDLADVIGDAGWDANLAEGTITFGERSFSAGLLGSYGAGAGTWLWAWANQAMEDLPDAVLATSKRMRALGQAQTIPELTESETELDEDMCHQIAMIAVGETGAGAYYRGPYDGGAAFLIVQEPIPVAPDRHRLLRIQRVIAESISTFPMNHRRAAFAWFEAAGLKTEPGEDDETLLEGEDGTLRLRFDTEGRIVEMKSLLHATKPKKSFFGRLFGKD